MSCIWEIDGNYTIGRQGILNRGNSMNEGVRAGKQEEHVGKAGSFCWALDMHRKGWSGGSH